MKKAHQHKISPQSDRAFSGQSNTTAASVQRDANVNNTDKIHYKWISATLFPLLLVLAGIGVYWNSLPGVFLFDDQLHIVNNRIIRQLWPLNRLIVSSGTRPTLYLTLAINYAYDGLHPTWYHIFNISVHIAAGLFLFGLVRRTLRLPHFVGLYDKSANNLAFAVALIWIVHPLQTQAVNYIVQRCESMMAMGFLACLYFHVRSLTATRSLPWHLLAFAAFCLSVGSKEVGVMAIPVVFLFDRMFVDESWHQFWRYRSPMLLLMAAPVALGAVRFGRLMLFSGAYGTGFGATGITAWEYIISQPAVVLHYLRLALWPDVLCFDYGWPVEDRVFLGWILPIAILGLILVQSLWAYSRGISAGFLGLSFFVILAPTSTIIPIQDLAVEHRMYLPLATVITAIVLGIDTFLRQYSKGVQRAVATTLLATTCIVFATLTANRNVVYHSGIYMWSDVIEKTAHTGRQRRSLDRGYTNLSQSLGDASRWPEALKTAEAGYRVEPNSVPLLANLVRCHLELGQYTAARQYAERLIELEPRSGLFQNFMGKIAAGEKDPIAAEAHFLEALKLDNEHPAIHASYGKFLADQNRLDEAEAQFRETLHLDPTNYMGRRQLAAVFAKSKRMEDAFDEADTLIRQFPKNADAHFLRAQMCLSTEKINEAQKSLERAIELDDSIARFHLLLGKLLLQQEKKKAAFASLERAVKIDPQFAEAYDVMGIAAFPSSPIQAANYFAEAIRVQPSYAEARYHLATALMQMGNLTDAIEHLRVILKQYPDFPPAEAALRSALELQANNHLSTSGKK